MAKVIAVFTQKGGVGKTTIASNLLAELKYQGKKVIGVDLDSQGNLSKLFGAKTENENTVSDFLAGECKFEDIVQHNEVFGDIIPSDNYLQPFIVSHYVKPENLFSLNNIVEGFKNNYDYVIIDCPPNNNLLTFSALIEADEIVVPLILDYFAMDAFKELVRTIMTEVVPIANKKYKLLLIVNKYNARYRVQRKWYKILEKTIEVQLSEKIEIRLLKNKLSDSPNVQELQMLKKSLRFNKHKQCEEFSNIVQELIEEVQ